MSFPGVSPGLLGFCLEIVPEPFPVSIHDRIAKILTRHVSPILADGLLTRALRECRLTVNTLSGENLIVLYAQLEAGVRLDVVV